MRKHVALGAVLLIAMLVGSARADDVASMSFALPAQKESSAPRIVELLHFSPDGKRLAVGGVNYFALLDSSTLRPVAEAGRRLAEREVRARVDRGELMVTVNGKLSRRNWTTGRFASDRPSQTGYDIGLGTEHPGTKSKGPRPIRLESPVIDGEPGSVGLNPQAPRDPTIFNTIWLTPRGSGPLRLFVARLPRFVGNGLNRPDDIVAFSLSPSGKFVAGVIKAGYLYIWDVSGRPEGRVAYAGEAWETVDGASGARITWLENDSIIALNAPDGMRHYVTATGEMVVSPPNVPAPDNDPARFTPAGSEILPDPRPDGRRFVSPDGKLIVEYAQESLDPRGNSGRKRPILIVRTDVEQPPVGKILLPDDNDLGYFVYSPDGTRVAASFESGVIVVVSADDLRAGAAREALLSPGASASTLVENPVFASWNGIEPGGYAEFETTLLEQGATSTRVVRVTLEQRVAGEGLRTSVREPNRPVDPPNGDVPVSVSTSLNVPAQVSPAQAEESLMPPGESVEFKEIGREKVSAAGRVFDCIKFERKASESAHSSVVRYWMSPDAPGLVVKRESDSTSPNARRTETTILRSLAPRR